MAYEYYTITFSMYVRVCVRQPIKFYVNCKAGVRNLC